MSTFSAVERCSVTELPKDGCEHCRPKRAVTVPTVEYGPVFRAQYPGRCAECDDGIAVGETIAALVVDGEGGEYVHEECVG